MLQVLIVTGGWDGSSQLSSTEVSCQNHLMKMRFRIISNVWSNISQKVKKTRIQLLEYPIPPPRHKNRVCNGSREPRELS